MPDDLHPVAAVSLGHLAMAVGTPNRALVAGWCDGFATFNLRGSADDVAFVASAERAIGIELPRQACTSTANSSLRVVWAGPDEWFVVSSKDGATQILNDVREGLAGMHHAVTDVSSGYTLLHLSGISARDVLAQGCPLDLHPRTFKPGMSARSHFFKTTVLIWQTDDAPTYELLVGRSFMGYFWLMLERCTLECNLLTKRVT